MSDGIYDVRQDQYPTVIREMIRHENDVTNHRIMWLLIGEGFIANAYVAAKIASMSTYSMLSVVGTLLALSAFVMLYRSYQARGYLQFLGQLAKRGTLQEEQLPLVGWPRKRIKGWWRDSWICPWFRKIRDLFEPWLLLPYVFTSIWMMVVLRARSSLNTAEVLILGVILSALILSASCIALVWSQSKDDESTDR
jgi:hypothetical protein